MCNNQVPTSIVYDDDDKRIVFKSQESYLLTAYSSHSISPPVILVTAAEDISVLVIKKLQFANAVNLTTSQVIMALIERGLLIHIPVNEMDITFDHDQDGRATPWRSIALTRTVGGQEGRGVCDVQLPVGPDVTHSRKYPGIGGASQVLLVDMSPEYYDRQIQRYKEDLIKGESPTPLCEDLPEKLVLDPDTASMIRRLRSELTGGSAHVELPYAITTVGDRRTESLTITDGDTDMDKEFDKHVDAAMACLGATSSAPSANVARSITLVRGTEHDDDRIISEAEADAGEKANPLFYPDMRDAVYRGLSPEAVARMKMKVAAIFPHQSEVEQETTSA